MAFIPYLEFVKIPLTFYKTIGQNLFPPSDEHRIWPRLRRIFFIAVVVSYNAQWFAQIMLFIMGANAQSMPIMAAVAPCIAFGFLGNAKQMTLTLNKPAIRGILTELEAIYPSDLNMQKNLNVSECVRTLRHVMKFFAGLCIFNSFYFGLYPILKSVHKSVFLGEEFDFPLGFPMWYPYDYTSNWFVYIVTVCLQLNAGYLTGVGFLTADLLLVSSVSQLCMHFDYISKKLKQYVPTSSTEDHKFLRDVIEYHARCLGLSDSVDRIFSLSLFLNFMSSAITLCFVGFQVMSVSVEEVLRFCVLLLISLAQVFIVCIYGNNLIDTSLSVSDAAFEHPWYECDLVYKKMLLVVIHRSQKCAAIRAPTFPPISLETFMKVLSMSYQFFAVLQTMDSK